MLGKITLKLAIFALFISLGIDIQAHHAMSNVIINGQQLSVEQLYALQNHLGTRVAPGNYLSNTETGCWINLSNGQKGCIQQSGSTFSRYGSGSRSSNGQWNHWSNAAGGAVAGDRNGCIYTSFGWSNC